MDLNSEAVPQKPASPVAGEPGSTDFKLSDFLFRTVDGSKWEVPDAATFDFAGFYDWMIDCRHLLVPKSDMTWIDEQKVAAGQPVDIFVNMSCGSQLAPHITMEIPGVLRALGVSFTAGSGRQFCCGKIYKTRDHWDAGEKLGQASIDRFLGWGAKTAVHQCHSCQIVYSEYTDRVAQAAPGMTNVHISEFIEKRLLELGDKVPWKKRLDYRVLVEGFGPELSPVHHAATQAELRMLALVPGITVLGIVEPPSRGAPCKTNVPSGPSILAFLTAQERDEVKADLDAQAERRGGANVIAPNAHYCQREWSKFSTDKVAVKSWISILAEALGCSYPDRYQEYWRLMDPARVVEITRPTWESWGLSPQKARWAADKHFDPHYTGFVNLACACGGDPENCNTGLESGVIGVEVARAKNEDHQAAGHVEHSGH